MGERIKSARKSAGLTQQKTADLLGVTVRSYQKYEDATVEPPLNTLVSLCIIFGVTSDLLLGLAGGEPVGEPQTSPPSRPKE